MASDGEGVPPFSKARTAGGIGLLILVFVLYVFDLVSPDFRVDTLHLGLILGAALMLLGVEGGKLFLRR